VTSDEHAQQCAQRCYLNPTAIERSRDRRGLENQPKWLCEIQLPIPQELVEKVELSVLPLDATEVLLFLFFLDLTLAMDGEGGVLDTDINVFLVDALGLQMRSLQGEPGFLISAPGCLF
jgi:hypothetical protein